MKNRTKMMIRATASAIAVIAFSAGAPACAQEIDVTNARTSDTVSSGGVSYLLGSFVFDVPLLEIGTGEWPNKLSATLHYDSSSQVVTSNISGWTLSTNSGISGIVTEAVYDESDPYDECNCEPLFQYWRYGAFFSTGAGLSSFEILEPNLESQDFAASTLDGSKLQWVSSNPGGYFEWDGWNPNGTFTLTTHRGDQVQIGGTIQNGELKFDPTNETTTREGVRLTEANSHFEFGSSLTSSLGYKIVSQKVGSSVKICAYNLALVDASSTSDCNSSPLVATVNFTGNFVSSIVRPDGSTYNFGYTRYYAVSGDIYSAPYSNRKERYHLTCVTMPGDTGCSIANTYDACDGYRGANSQYPAYYDPNWTGSRDRVIRQDFRDGSYETFSYTGHNQPCRDVQGITRTKGGTSQSYAVTRAGNSPVNRQALIKTAGHVSQATDALSRSWTFEWGGGNSIDYYLKRNDLATKSTNPEGDLIQYTYDSRGNVTEARQKAKPGSGVADVVTTAAFPSTCSNSKTCNRPSSVTDPKGNVTTYEYGASHGMVTKVTMPLDANGNRPEIRYAYQQRYAWLKSGAGYVQSAVPFWVLTSEEFCKVSSADSAGNCLAGAGDKVVTSYEYEQGNSSKGSNVRLLGIAVTADGQTLRTCFGYDQFGRKVSETQPMGTGSSCS